MEGNLQSRAKSGKCSSRDQRTLTLCDSCNLFGHTSVNRDSKFQKIPELAGKLVSKFYMIIFVRDYGVHRHQEGQ